MSTQASIEALKDQNQSGKRKTVKDQIYDYISKNPFTHNYAIIRDLKLNKSTATARISDLLDEGVIYVIATGKVMGYPNKLSLYKKEKYPIFISINRELRLEQKRKQLIKKAEETAKIFGISVKELMKVD